MIDVSGDKPPKPAHRVVHLSTHDGNGGAARAAFRIHRAQVENGLDSRMRVLHKSEQDERVLGSTVSRMARLESRLVNRYEGQLRSRWSTSNTVLHSFGYQRAGLLNQLNAADADVYNLHWISGLLSISDVGRLTKPIVWTLHDMWAFCGAEHYSEDDSQARWRLGYNANNRPEGERGPDLNRMVWERKRRSWKTPMTLVAPSRWMGRCAQESVLFRDAKVHVIPYPINTELWCPVSQAVAREALSLPRSGKLILFGADGGTADPRKGGAELREALGLFAPYAPGDVHLLIYGEARPNAEPGARDWPVPIHWLGQIRDDRVLRLAYCAADVFVLPSRQDNLPNTAIEAHACGVPVVAFDIGGLVDIIGHRETGYLAKPFDVDDLVQGIKWVLADTDRLARLRDAARSRAEKLFAPSVVARMYEAVYREVVTTRPAP